MSIRVARFPVLLQSVLLASACLAAAPALAQIDDVIAPPPNLVLSNYYSATVGPYSGLEGTAYAARVEDPSATWFNPAGLARQTSAQISGSAGVYQHTLVAPRALPNQGGSVQQLPNFVGFTFSPRTNLTVGAALLTTNSWNQETDSELFSTTASGQQRFAYSADSNFEQRVAAISAGYGRGGPWRVGGGFAVELLSFRLVQSVSDRLADSSGLRTLLVAGRTSGSALLLRTQAGAQYDHSHWRFGVAMRTPAVAVHKSGVVTLDGTFDGTSVSYGASVFDTDAELEYHLPWEFQGGAAFVTDRYEVELDVQAYSPISAYSLLSTSHPLLVYGDTGSGAPPIVTSRPFGGLTSASDSVVNVGAGGSLRLFKNRDLRLHGGIGSNQSPVGAADTVFTKIDLATWSVGLGGSLGKFRFGAGVNHQSGRADDVVLRNLLDGQTVRTPVDVSVTGFVYSLGYRF